jgi:hypothetical protein
MFDDDHSQSDSKFMNKFAKFQIDSDGYEPLICGSLTGYETKRMMPVHAMFCRENQPPFKFKEIQEKILKLA